MDEQFDAPNSPRNIVVFSDGTGQVGGIYFDEARTNIYKLYRATRAGPDTSIDPDRQIAFYDPGLGTLQPGGSFLYRSYRKIYNFVSQATGLGITQNIVDCYAAIIALWRPGDRIFLFGFSRGAYTVRCVATVLFHCGVPQKDRKGNPLKLDASSVRAVAFEGVKSVYQHVSSPRDKKYLSQRRKLGAIFRKDYGSMGNSENSEPNAIPFFIGVFDTVASLSSTGSLILLVVLYFILHIALATALSFMWPPLEFWYWFNWISVWSLCIGVGAYVYTHLKFSTRLKDYYFWDVIHLTKFRQKFYDGFLWSKVRYARHALSIDERRHSFPRVIWGGKNTTYGPGVLEQKWFAGNHADIGGGYIENESRLSDIALSWMVDAATNSALGGDALLVDRRLLNLNGRASGMLHDETQSSFFRWAKKSPRRAFVNADLHDTVIERFEMKEVQDYNCMKPYRPEPLRFHQGVMKYYKGTNPVRVTCFQRLEDLIANTRNTLSGIFYFPREKIMPKLNYFGRLDSFVSCIGLTGLLIAVITALVLLVGYQIIPWLGDAVWRGYPLSTFIEYQSGWVGLQLIVDWLLYLPATLIFVLLGIGFFWLMGLVSAKLYELSGDPPE